MTNRQIENKIRTDLRARLKKWGVKFKSIDMLSPAVETGRIEVKITLPKGYFRVYYDTEQGKLIPPNRFIYKYHPDVLATVFEFSKSGVEKFKLANRSTTRKGAPAKYLTSLRETAQDLDPSVKSKDINNQEDFIYVCIGNNWDSFSCLGMLRRAGVKRLSKKSKQLLRDEDAWSEFDDEIYFDSEVYPEGPE